MTYIHILYIVSTGICLNHVSVHLSNRDISQPPNSSQPYRKTFNPSHAGLWGLARAARLECDFQIHMLDWEKSIAFWLRSKPQKTPTEKVTLLETNSSHLEVVVSNRNLLFQWYILRGELLVSGRVGENDGAQQWDINQHSLTWNLKMMVPFPEVYS